MTEQRASLTQSGSVQGTGLDVGLRVRNGDDHGSRRKRVRLAHDRMQWDRRESKQEQEVGVAVTFADGVSQPRTGGSGPTKEDR